MAKVQSPSVNVRVDEILWEWRRDADTNMWFAYCDQFGQVVEADAEEDLDAAIRDSMATLVRYLWETGTLKAFLDERGLEYKMEFNLPHRSVVRDLATIDLGMPSLSLPPVRRVHVEAAMSAHA